MDTSTPEGRLKRMEQLEAQYRKTGNIIGLVNLIGGSADDFRDINSGSHPDERYAGQEWS